MFMMCCVVCSPLESLWEHLEEPEINSEELEDVLQNEGSLGRSTPPHDYSSNGGDEFTFKSVKS